MNRQIRRVAVFVLVLFFLMFSAPFYWQVVASDKLANDPRNARKIFKEYSLERGKMVLRSGQPVAISVATNDKLKFQRSYPQGERYGMITGFYSLVFGSSLAESTFNTYLVGKAPEQFAQNLVDLFTARSTPGGTLRLTIDPTTQTIAERELRQRKGAVVALDYKTGKVLAMTTFPRYDPNQLSSHDSDKIRANWNRLLKDPNQPLLNRAADALYPPGSTFKVVTAAAALEDGINADQPLPSPNAYTPPKTTKQIRNFGGGTCSGSGQLTLTDALTISCNTTFAALGNRLGPTKLSDEAEKFGLNDTSPYQLRAATSSIPREMDPPATAQSAIGQRDVRVSPLQMATVAATIANGGKRMAPHVVDEVVDDSGKRIKTFRNESLGQVIPGNVAEQVKQMMGAVVERGTGSFAKIPGVQVFGKTGTAQNAEGAAPHAWFIGFAEQGDRSIAVAVVIENGGDLGSEATGGHVAAPVAKEVMQAYLGAGQ
jgi:peptidoglycan glycosyltransferase